MEERLIARLFKNDEMVGEEDITKYTVDEAANFFALQFDLGRRVKTVIRCETKG